VPRHAWRTTFDEVSDSSILKTPPLSTISSPGTSAQHEPRAATIAKRFSALEWSGRALRDLRDEVRSTSDSGKGHLSPHRTRSRADCRNHQQQTPRLWGVESTGIAIRQLVGPARYARPIPTCNSAIGDQHRPAQQRAAATAMIAPESQPAGKCARPSAAPRAAPMIRVSARRASASRSDAADVISGPCRQRNASMMFWQTRGVCEGVHIRSRFELVTCHI